MLNTEPRDLFSERLRKLRRRTLIRVSWFGLARMVGVGGSMLMVTAWLLGNEVQPEKFITWGLLVSLGAGLVALAWNNLLGRLWRLRSQKQLVKVLERWGYFSNVLVASEEALRDPQRWNDETPVATELRNRLFKRGAAFLENLGPADAVPINRQGQTWLSVAACLLITVALFTSPGNTLQTGWARLWNPWSIWTAPPTGGLYAVSSDGFVVAGRNISIAALDATGDPNAVQCEILIGSGVWQRVPTRREVMFTEHLGVRAPFRKWVANLEVVQEDFRWRFRRGEMITEINLVEVRRHPLVTELAGYVQPPAYTHLNLRKMSRLPTWMEAQRGSLLGLSGETNHPLRRMLMVSDAGDTTVLDFAGKSFAGEFQVKKSMAFQLVLEDSFGLRNLDPLRYEIVATNDDPPTVGLQRVADDGVLPVHGLVDLRSEAADDFGLSKLSLGLRVLTESESETDTGPDYENLTLWSGSGLAAVGDDGWLQWNTSAGAVSLRPRFLNGMDPAASQPLQAGLTFEARFDHLDLVPGDILELRSEAGDNRQPGPAGIGYSSVLRMKLPSAADVLAAQADSSQERRSELETVRQRSKQLSADLDRLTRELLKNPIPDWARQQEMEAAMERQKKMQEELAKVAQQLQEDVDKLASGQMTSEKMLDRAEQVSQLLDQSSSEELNAMMEKMENADGRLSPEELAEAMKEVAKNQKEMARKLDAALAMLQRMDQEQEMEGIASLLEKMIRKQQELADMSRQLAEQQNKEENAQQDGAQQDGQQQEDKSGAESEKSSGNDESGKDQNSGNEETPDAEELARRQEALAEEMDQLQEKLEEALANLEEQNAEKSTPGSEEMQEALEQALEKMEEQQSKDSMSEASEELAKMDPEMAAKLQQQALRDMGALYHVILETQSAMQMAMEQNQVTSLRQLAADMLVLSARQEDIAGQIPARIRDVRSLNLTRSQHRVQKAAVGLRDRLSDLLSENPTQIMRLLEKLDEVIESMGESLSSLEDNRAQNARKGASGSLAQSNRMVIGLLTEAQMSSSSSGGSGEQKQQQKSMSEQLKDMAKDQAELNAMTEALRQKLANRGMSQKARSQMKRLGEGQGQLAGRMQELAEEARETPEGERVLGDLGELGRVMETISQEVQQGLVSEETLVRQERILSRMLDARNSVRQRDYSSRRESRTARELYNADGSLKDDPFNGGDHDPFEMRYIPLEKAPLEYRGLVRKYFQALEALRQSGPFQTEVP